MMLHNATKCNTALSDALIVFQQEQIYLKSVFAKYIIKMIPCQHIHHVLRHGPWWQLLALCHCRSLLLHQGVSKNAISFLTSFFFCTCTLFVFGILTGVSISESFLPFFRNDALSLQLHQDGPCRR